MSVATFRSQFGLAREDVAYGSTGTLGIRWIPVLSFDPGWKDDVDYVVDKGIRGNPSMDFAMYQGVRKGRWIGTHYFHPDTAGVFLRAIFGGETITQSSAGAIGVHAFGTTDRPPSYTLWDYYGVSAGSSQRMILGAQLERAEFAWNRATGALTVKPSWVGFGSTGVAQIAASYAQSDPHRGWEAIAAIAGTTNTRILEFTSVLSRAPVSLIYGGNNTQAPNAREVGPLEHTGTLVAYGSTSLEFDRFLANSTGSLSVSITDVPTSSVLAWTVTDWRIEDVVIDRGGGYARWDIKWRGLYNATDTGPGTMSLSVASTSSF